MSATLYIQNETFQNLLNDLNVPLTIPLRPMPRLLHVNARFIKDLKINTGNVLNNTQYLNRKEVVVAGAFRCHQ